MTRIVLIALFTVFLSCPAGRVLAAGYTTQALDEILENVDSTDKDEAGEMDKELEEEAEDDRAAGEDA